MKATRRFARSISQSFHDHLLRTCQAAGFTPMVVQEAAELLTLLHFVGAGFGVALVPDSARAMRVPHVSYRETDLEEASWTIGVVWRRRERPDPLVESFVSLASAIAGKD